MRVGARNLDKSTGNVWLELAAMVEILMTKNVLIIDDCVEMQCLLKMLLESKGYHIDCSSNGEEALSLLATSERLPDVILLDLRMPIMDGLAFLNTRRKILRLKEIPIVLMSGNEDVEATGQAGDFAEILKKPLNILALVQAVKRNSELH